MKIVCPTCEATYEVPEAVVAAGRQMRCARCGNNWVPAAADAAPTIDAFDAADEALPMAVLVPADEPPVSADAAVPEAASPPKPAALEPAPQPPDTKPPEPSRPEPATKIQPELLRPKPATPPRAEQLGKDGKPLGPQPPKPRAPVAAWVASIVLLLGIAGAATVFRIPVMKAWPPSTRLYAAVGLYHP